MVGTSVTTMKHTLRPQIHARLEDGTIPFLQVREQHNEWPFTTHFSSLQQGHQRIAPAKQVTSENQICTFCYLVEFGTNHHPLLCGPPPPSQQVLALRHGFDWLHDLGGMAAVGRHTTAITLYALWRLASLEHIVQGGDGQVRRLPVVEAYGEYMPYVWQLALTCFKGGVMPQPGAPLAVRGARGLTTALSTACVASSAGRGSLMSLLGAVHRIQGPVISFNVRAPTCVLGTQGRSHGPGSLDAAGRDHARKQQECLGMLCPARRPTTVALGDESDACVSAAARSDRQLRPVSAEAQGCAVCSDELTFEYVSPALVGRLARSQGITVRSGCFCNPGACQRYLGLNDRVTDASLQVRAGGNVCYTQYTKAAHATLWHQ